MLCLSTGKSWTTFQCQLLKLKFIMNGGNLTMTHSHLYHYWHFPTMVGFCHGGNMPASHHNHHHHHSQVHDCIHDFGERGKKEKCKKSYFCLGTNFHRPAPTSLIRWTIKSSSIFIRISNCICQTHNPAKKLKSTLTTRVTKTKSETKTKTKTKTKSETKTKTKTMWRSSRVIGPIWSQPDGSVNGCIAQIRSSLSNTAIMHQKIQLSGQFVNDKKNCFSFQNISTTGHQRLYDHLLFYSQHWLGHNNKDTTTIITTIWQYDKFVVVIIIDIALLMRPLPALLTTLNGSLSWYFYAHMAGLLTY